ELAHELHPVAGGCGAAPLAGDQRHAAEAPELAPHGNVGKRLVSDAARDAAAELTFAERQVGTDAGRRDGDPGRRAKLPPDDAREDDAAIDPAIAFRLDRHRAVDVRQPLQIELEPDRARLR